MKLLLLFPPQWIPHQPYLGLPSLTAYLRKNDVEVVQKDLNIESYDHFLSRTYLRSLKPRLDVKFAAIDGRPQLAPGLEPQLYADLYLGKSSVHHLADSIDEAKSVFRTPRYFDANLLSKARETVCDSLAVISAAFFPTRLELTGLTIPSYDGTFTSIDTLTADRDQNPYIEYFEGSVLAYVRSQSPEVVGISITGETQLLPALTLSRLIKNHFPSTHIVFGGYIVTLLVGVFKKNTQLFGRYMDSLIVLEGERPMLELVKKLEKGESLEGVPNLIYFDGEAIRENQPIAPEQMDSLPPPDFDGLPLEKYLSPEPVLPLLVSRGCYWGKCAFCSHNISYENRYRVSKAKKIIADIETLANRYNTRHFAFSDEAISPKVMRDLTSSLIERKANFRFSTNVRLETQFDADLCQRMYDAGFRIVYLGLESGCDRVLGLMQKGFTCEDALKTCRALTGAGIWDHLYVFFGFPGELESEARQTMKFLLDARDAVRSFNIGAFTLTRGSEVMTAPQKYGVTLPQGDASANFAIGFAYDLTQGISWEQASNMSEDAWDRLADAYPTREVLRMLSKEDLLLYLSKYESTDPQLSTIKPHCSPGSEGGIPKSHTVTQDSRPRLAGGIVRSTLNFDLQSIFRDPVRYMPTRSVQTRILFNPANHRLRTIDLNVWDILDLCNGERSIRKIARLLSDNRGVPTPQFDSFCVSVLGDLTTDGYIQA